mmetsp:Transcript_2511/g.4566  ORF Transcript_2511/g.4566 Transcript_2511/m.4566 type:complete len:203 (+) Transcript_2511:1386-1994(+)
MESEATPFPFVNLPSLPRAYPHNSKTCFASSLNVYESMVSAMVSSYDEPFVLKLFCISSGWERSSHRSLELDFNASLSSLSRLLGAIFFLRFSFAGLVTIPTFSSVVAPNGFLLRLSVSLVTTPISLMKDFAPDFTASPSISRRKSSTSKSLFLFSNAKLSNDCIISVISGKVFPSTCVVRAVIVDDTVLKRCAPEEGDAMV